MTERFTYNAVDQARPHVHPLRTPSGFTLTRNAPEDHPWHHALWFTVKFVDGDNFWEELEPFGVLHQRDDHHLDWVRPDGLLALREERVLTEVDLGEDAWALDWSTVLEAPEAVVLDRTPFTTWGGYGGLSLRGSAEWTDTRLLLSDGTSKRRITGTPATWLDLSGPAGGVSVLDAPDNPRAPVPWYASTKSKVYGGEEWSNFLNAAFLFHEPLALAAGEQLRFRYRVVVHDGVWEAERVQAAWDDWVS